MKVPKVLPDMAPTYYSLFIAIFRPFVIHLKKNNHLRFGITMIFLYPDLHTPKSHIYRYIYSKLVHYWSRVREILGSNPLSSQTNDL